MTWILKALAFAGVVIYNGWHGTSPGAVTRVPTVDVVKITEYVQHVPMAVPTVTVTATVAYVTPNPVVHALPSRTARPRPAFDAYESESDSELPADSSSSLADWLVFLGQWLAEERISPLQILVFLSLALSVFCTWYLASLLMKKHVLHCAYGLHDWYVGRMESHRLDQIFNAQPLPHDAVYRAFFPSWYPLSWVKTLGPFPVNIITVLLKVYQMAVFLAHTPWLALQIVIECVGRTLDGLCKCVDLLIAETIRRFPHRAEQFVEAVFGLEELSWDLLLATVVKMREALTWTFCTSRRFLFSLYKVLRFFFRLHVHRVLMKRERAETMERCELAFNANSRRAWAWAFQTTYQQMVDFFLDNEDLQAKFDELQATHDEMMANFPKDHVRELANKTTAYRDSLIAAIGDINYWRTIVCHIMNWQHNVCTGRSINGPDSQHPYKPSMIRFSVEAHPVTGLYFTMNEATESQKAIKRDWIEHTVAFYWDKKKNFYRMPNFMQRKLAGADHFVPHGLDPFKEDTWVIEANFPGIVLAPFEANKNPINIFKKRPVPIVQPEKRFGRLIEDVASSGSLQLWRGPEPKKRFPLGTLNNVRRHMSLLPITPRPQPFCLDPCPDGSPMDVKW